MRSLGSVRRLCMCRLTHKLKTSVRHVSPLHRKLLTMSNEHSVLRSPFTSVFSVAGLHTACRGVDTAPQVRVTPTKSLIDEDLHITVTGLPPHHNVTLVSRVEEGGARFFSHAYYRSNHNGEVDVRTMAAQPGGSYEGVEPMGFVWSMEAEPGQAPGRRLMKSNVTTPLETNIYILDGQLSPKDCLDDILTETWLGHTTCDRWYLADGVERIEILEGRLIATMFIPQGAGPFPGVLDLFGTVGGLTEHRSALLASRGVASITVQYARLGKSGENKMEITKDIEYFEEAIDKLLSHPKVRKPSVGVIGVSKGGELSYIIGALCPKVRFSIIINGNGFFALEDHTYKGETFPQYPYDLSFLDQTGGGVSFHKLMDAMGEEDHAKHDIPVERNKNCDYVIVHSEDDMCTPSHSHKHVTERLDRHGMSNYRVIVYPGAGHLLEPPHSPHFSATYHPSFGTLVLWGGQPKPHAVAQVAFWKKTLEIIKSTLGSSKL